MAEVGTTYVRVKLDTSDIVAQCDRIRRAFAEDFGSVYVLLSGNYAPESGPLVGIFASRAAAETYMNEATPPVADGEILEWAVAA